MTERGERLRHEQCRRPRPARWGNRVADHVLPAPRSNSQDRSRYACCYRTTRNAPSSHALAGSHHKPRWTTLPPYAGCTEVRLPHDDRNGADGAAREALGTSEHGAWITVDRAALRPQSRAVRGWSPVGGHGRIERTAWRLGEPPVHDELRADGCSEIPALSGEDDEAGFEVACPLLSLTGLFVDVEDAILVGGPRCADRFWS